MFPLAMTLSEQIVSSPSYYHAGRRRNKQHGLFKFTLSGEGRFWNADGVHPVPPGTGFLCTVGDPETGYFYPEEGREHWSFVYISFINAQQHIAELTDRFGPLYTLPMDSPTVHHLQSFSRYGHSHVDLSLGEAHMLASRVFAALMDAGLGLKQESASSKLVVELRRRLRATVEEAVTVADLAADLAVSPEHLCRVCRAETGRSPVEMIAREKMRHACDLLLTTSLSIKEIANAVGYDRSSHLARTFRRITGMSPTEFRRNESTPIV